MKDNGYSVLNLIFVFCFLFVLTPSIQAFSVLFDSNYFAISGPYATQTATIINDGAKMLPVQVDMLTRSEGLLGEEINQVCTADFLIVPRQLLIQPNDEATVTIMWTGVSNPNKELAYRLKFKELALPQAEEEIAAEKKVKGASAKLTFLTAYMKTVFVAPPPPFVGKADTVLDSASPMIDPKTNKKMLALIFNNKGTVHDVLQHVGLTIKSGDKSGKTVTVSPSELVFLSILADSKRKVIMPWPEGLPYGDVQCSFKVGL